MNNTFNYNGDTYKILTRKDTKDVPRIINLRTNLKPENQKGLLRTVLAKHGYDIPTTESINTHTTIDLLYRLLNNIPLTDKQKALKII